MTDHSVSYEMLNNGLEFMGLVSRHAPVVSIQCWLKAGSIMESREDGFQPGLAHFLEHMTFKGSSKCPAGELSAQIEAWGGDINAYTTFDRTVYYLTVPKEHTFSALDLLVDSVFSSALQEEHVSRERDVILEEISRSIDDPATVAATKIFKHAYGDSEAGRPVIGTAESVGAITRDDLVRFRDQFYQPGNGAMVVVGDFEPAGVTEWLEANVKPTGGAPQRGSPIWGKSLDHAKIPMRREPFTVDFVRGDYQQVRFDLAITIPDQDHIDIPALDMCAYLIGGGDLGLLNRDLRDGQGIISSAAATLFSPAFPGLFEISFVTSEALALRAVEAVAALLASFSTSAAWGHDDLARAKSAIRAEKVFREETIDGLSRFGYGVSTVSKHKYDAEWLSRLERLTVDDLRAAWRRWIVPENFHAVAVLPGSVAFDEQHVRQHFFTGAKQNKHVVAAQGQSPGSSKNQTNKAIDDTSVIQISEGVTFVYKQRPGAGLFSLVLATEGGQRAEVGPRMPAGTFNAIASNLARASKETDYQRFSWLVESAGADLAAFSGKDSLGLRLSCLNQDLGQLLPLLWQSLLCPEFPEAQFDSFRREVADYFRHQADSGATVCMRQLQKAVLGAHPYGCDIVGEPATIAGLECQELASLFASWIPAGPWVAAGCGSMSAAEAEQIIRTGFADFTPSGSRRTFSSDAIAIPDGGARITLPMDRQQVHLATGFPGPGWKSSERFAVDVLCNILGGTGGRLFVKLRDQEGLAYSVAPILSYGNNRGLIGAYIACARDKLDRAENGIWEEFRKIADSGPSEAELERAKNYIRGSHVMELQSGEAQASTMALMELYGVGHDAYQKYLDLISGVDAKDVVDVAKKYLDRELAQTVVVGV